ncbi:ATP synthase F1 subunit delta [Portibacter lacus]|uniref:ATP synthase subunit delta n=1 Tax=Portibacter lacus TaxID=1099794 RepID=A0AA37WDL2_9BACT|nr:ATP synthase F1 subunit delta [Portibacter lacus]GLR18011.1 ATP synthase subunit delta [Portibacter lacus]
MSVIKVASRYAKSLLDLAKEQNNVEQVLGDIQSFKQAMENRELLLLTKSPIVSLSKKQAIFDQIFKGNFDKLTMSFFDIILRKGREAYLPEIATAFIDQYNRLKGISKVHITTATPLTEQALEAIRTKLIASDITDESIEFSTNVDPSIIGGLVIKIGDKLYDASVQRKLNELKKDFSENKYVKAF